MPYPVISLNDILKAMPNFNRIQLDRWEKKGYVKKIRREYYALPTALESDSQISSELAFYAANKIYSPSYISLEKALKIYNFIPEEVFQITSVSTKKTSTFNTSIGSFSYRHIKPSLFFGYVLAEWCELGFSASLSSGASPISSAGPTLGLGLGASLSSGLGTPGRPKILLAEPEKAILDYIYLNPRLKTVDDFAEMRINVEEFNKKIDLYKLLRYLEAFENKALSVRAETFLTVVQK